MESPSELSFGIRAGPGPQRQRSRAGRNEESIQRMAVSETKTQTYTNFCAKDDAFNQVQGGN